MQAVRRTGPRAKDEREANRIPGIVYGHGSEAQSIAVPRSEFLKLAKAAGFSSLVDLTIDGVDAGKVLIKEIQMDPILTEPIHVDFYKVRMDEKLTAKVPLKFVGESGAVKNSGGTLVKSMDEVEVECLPADLPHEIEINLSVLNTFEDSITVGTITLPKGVIVKDDVLQTIATVARPLTEDELKKMEEGAPADLSAIKTEGEEKKAEEEAKKAEEAALEEKKK